MIVLLNLYGDIFSDFGVGIVGGFGVVFGMNVGF